MSSTAKRERWALSRAAGIDLGAYRETHVAERIRRALGREGVAGPEQLALLLARDPEARARFRRSIAVSTTGLFRDPAQFELLEQRLLPPLVASQRRIRAWSAGCSDGTELYSIALVLHRLGALENSFLLGSDLLEENVERARGTKIEGLPRVRLRFEQRDLLSDGAPPGRWTLVLCRNVAIYLEQEPKRRLHELLAGALARDGLLMLGKSERIADPGSMGLEPAGPHVYRRAA